MSWADNIPKQGVLCIRENGQIEHICYVTSLGCHTKNGNYIDEKDFLRPLTPQEVWELMPWNYDMDSADKSGKNIILKDGFGNVEASSWGIDTWWSNTTGSRFYSPIAWLPLPEQSK